MIRLTLATGVAALAIVAPAAATPHGGHGGGNGGHGGSFAMAPQHGGGGHADRNRGGGEAQQRVAVHQQRMAPHQERVAAHQQQPSGHAQQRMAIAHPQRVDRHAQARERAQANAQVNARANERGRLQAQQLQASRNERALARVQQRNLGRNNNPVVSAQERSVAQARVINTIANERLATAAGYGIGGCPPGLAKKPVACMPPGQARKLVNAPLAEAQRIASLNRLPVRLESIYPTTPDYYYRYGNGYLYQVNSADNVIRALMPLFGAGYAVGQAFPSAYPYYALPAAYQPFYVSNPYTDYRYANGYVYQVNPLTGMITAVDPMLGYGYGYGQVMPAAYSAYNVPYQYRPLYYDTSDYYYRYAPGAIYQVDPTTSLITAVAALLSNGMTVGQPLPTGYGVYNVPYAYRTTYYDTPTDWYRYSNGYVYRVDPSTLLVTAIVASALT